MFDRISAHCSGDLTGRRILDLGCGQGYWAVYLASLGALVTASDISQTNVDITSLHAKANDLDTSKHYREAFAQHAFAEVRFEELGVFSRLDRFLRGHSRLQRWLHDSDYVLGRVMPFRRTFARNVVIAARKVS